MFRILLRSNPYEDSEPLYEDYLYTHRNYVKISELALLIEYEQTLKFYTWKRRILRVLR